jgi:hypothetical protein
MRQNWHVACTLFTNNRSPFGQRCVGVFEEQRDATPAPCEEDVVSRAVRHTESQETTRQSLHGASKHVGAAALVSALVQLGVVVVSPAVAQAVCVDVVNQTCATVPEPGTLALVSVGAGVAAGAAWWKRRGKK